MNLMGSEKNKASCSPKNEEIFSLACRLYQNGACAQSYRLFKSIEKECEDEASFYVNSALCYIKAEEWQTALICLEKSLSILKKQSSETAYPPDSAYNLLESMQTENDAYLQPFPLTLPVLLPDYAKQSVLRLMIDTCVSLKLWDRVRLLGNPLRAKGYGNVNKALKIAEENL